MIEFLLAGATAVEVGTANYVEPGGAARLAPALADYLERHGFRAAADLKGALHLPGRGEETPVDRRAHG
jgi:dihydroorotate dehydrogenase (NAD+) catalytic subunit